MKKTPLGRILRGEIVALDGLGCGWLRIFLKEICKEHALMLHKPAIVYVNYSLLI